MGKRKFRFNIYDVFTDVHPDLAIAYISKSKEALKKYLEQQQENRPNKETNFKINDGGSLVIERDTDWHVTSRDIFEYSLNREKSVIKLFDLKGLLRKVN